MPKLTKGLPSSGGGGSSTPPPLSSRQKYITVGGSYSKMYPILWTDIKYDAVHGLTLSQSKPSLINMTIIRNDLWNRYGSGAAANPLIPHTTPNGGSDPGGVLVKVQSSAATRFWGQRITSFVKTGNDNIAYLTTLFRTNPSNPSLLDPDSSYTQFFRPYLLFATGGWFRGGGMTYLFEIEDTFDKVDFYHFTDYSQPTLVIPENKIFRTQNDAWASVTLTPINVPDSDDDTAWITSSNIGGDFYTNRQALGITGY